MFRTLKSLITGIVAGTALGVLFAPKKGTEVRKSFKKEIKEGGYGLKTAKSTLTGMGKEIGESYHEVKSSEGFKKGKDKIKKEAKVVFHKAKAAAKKAVAKVKAQIVSNGQED